MGIEQDDPARQAATEDAISRMEWEGSPLPAPFVKNSQFPERKGIIRTSKTSGIGEVQIQQVRPK